MLVDAEHMPAESSRTKNLRRATAMGVATLIGTACPAVPYLFFSIRTATGIAVGLTVLACVAIAEVRSRAREAGEATVAVFGGFDGLTCVIGLLAADLTANISRTKLVATCSGLAVASGLSMAFGEWLGDDFGIPRWRALTQTFVLIVLAAAASWATSSLLGAAG